MTIGAAIEVHRTIGPGFLEGIYEEALCSELRPRHIAFQRQLPVEIHYKDEPVGLARLDLVIGERLVVELKAVEAILPIHVAQLIAYLKALNQPLGLIINFNVPVLPQGVRRVIRTI